MTGTSPRFFLCYTDSEDWRYFLDAPQTTFGFGENHRLKVESLQPGDILLCYTRGSSTWCGALEVTGLTPLSDSVSPEKLILYPVRVPIRRLIVLSAEGALAIFDDLIWRSLSFTCNQTRSQGWSARAGLRQDLTAIPFADGQFLMSLLSGDVYHPPGTVSENGNAYNPQQDIDSRRVKSSQIIARQGQQAFRNTLLKSYAQRCCITGCTVASVLEAAHIGRYLGSASNSITNGLLLRADLHTLFDLGLIALDPASLTVMIAQELENSDYASLAGKNINLPSEHGSRPSPLALQYHLDRVFLPTKQPISIINESVSTESNTEN